MILYPGENSWNTVRLDKRNYTAQKAKEQQKELIKRIPEQYIYIDDRCFRNAGRIKEVILSPQCKIIGKQAFESCQFRKGIDFPATLIEIKKRAFAENHSLRQVIFPPSVKYIGTQCYRECNNLRIAKFENRTRRISCLTIIHVPAEKGNRFPMGGGRNTTIFSPFCRINRILYDLKSKFAFQFGQRTPDKTHVSPRREGEHCRKPGGRVQFMSKSVRFVQMSPSEWGGMVCCYCEKLGAGGSRRG